MILKVSTGPPPPTPFKAKIGPASDSISSDLVYPVTNGCRILNNRTTMMIYAGADPQSQDSSTGLFFITWAGKDHPNGPDRVKVPNAGALRVTGVHLDERATVRPQGELEFTSDHDITGTLDLPDDTVTITHG